MNIDKLIEIATVKRRDYHRKCAEDDDYTCWEVYIGHRYIGEIFKPRGENYYRAQKYHEVFGRTLDDAINDLIRHYICLLEAEAAAYNELKSLGELLRR